MIAILEDAVDVHLKHADAEHGSKRTLFLEAASWIEDHDSTWIFSFENICDMLDLDADCLREGLRAHKERVCGAGRVDVVPIRSLTTLAPILQSVNA